MPPLLVTDTHPLVWYISESFGKLPAKVKRAFDDAVAGRGAIFVPAAVLWELSLLIKAGKVRTLVPLEEYVQQHFFAKAISLLDIEVQDILQAHSLSFSPDPYDTLIVAMSLRAECPLITADSIITNAKLCPIFW